MQIFNNSLIYSASDLTYFLECPHRTTLDRLNLDQPMEKAVDSDDTRLVQEKGIEHERAYLDSLKSAGLNVVTIDDASSQKARCTATLDAMMHGADIIYQAAFVSDPWLGYADFLKRVERPSELGNYSYEPVDTKLSAHPKGKHLIQLCVYSDLLQNVQDVVPESMHLALGTGETRSFRVEDFRHYYAQCRDRFLGFVDKPTDTRPEPCDFCNFCHWRERCEKQWEAEDHLSLVANITRGQIRKLRDVDVHTVAALAALDQSVSVSGMARDVLERLSDQASLQVQGRTSGKPDHRLLKPDPDGRKGFYRMPRASQGDLFFDMEGDPLYPEGLEYLFGVYYLEDGEGRFTAFWAHDHDAEKKALEDFVDFVVRRLKQYPDAHIYHYNHYEVTAIKRLMSRYATREHEVDDLLRRQRFVDLFKVVRESIRVSEPSYSIKNLEHFYMEARDADVKTAVGSIVWYENWRETRDDNLLEQIRKYNEDDCRSTLLLRDWLLKIRPSDLPWFTADRQEESAGADRITEHEQRLARYEKALLGIKDASPEALHHNTLIYQLLDFYRREAKPQWWAMFARQDMEEGELIEDSECLGGLEFVSKEKGTTKSMDCVYRFPPQETKLKANVVVHVAESRQRLGTIRSLDVEDNYVTVRTTAAEIPQRLSIGPGGPVNTDVLKEALFRYADAHLDHKRAYSAIDDFLTRNPPRLKGRDGPAPLAPHGHLSQIFDAVERLDGSHLYIQGPPGAGKTYTGSHLIVSLMRKGLRVGVTSNSHKAIDNLLEAVEKVAQEEGVTFRGVKKTTQKNELGFEGHQIVACTSNPDIEIDEDYQLVAGTAWLFAREGFDQRFDYLFIDEAGQVSLANLVAMGTSARNLVLLGDQMQLSQPIQGSHPGHSGDSALDYLLNGRSVIEPERGVFLETTRRMHPDVCQFVSDAIYAGCLMPHEDNQKQRSILSPAAHPELASTGIRMVDVMHSDRGQHCPEEAEVIQAMYESLLNQRYVDKHGAEHPMTEENILVISPYNIQVNLLKSRLPAGARVGTVDKFQGQEAEAILISMATSDADNMPRNADFLFSRNRLNVAISRARCLAVVTANPALLNVPCKTVAEMELVNTLCWLKSYSDQLRTRN